MAEPDEKDLNAAERALGTAPRDNESSEERRDRQDWEAMLAPLGLAAPPAEPPADMFQRIERGLESDEGSAQVIQLAERRARRWRAVAFATSGIAACLMVIVAAGLVTLSDTVLDTPLPAQTSYTALVTPEGGAGPAMIVEVDTATSTATVRVLQVDVPADRALELWRVAEGTAPQSLGLIDPQNPLLQLAVDTEPGDTLAVSVEPPGGSPSGAPTGPVILSGPLLPAN